MRVAHVLKELDPAYGGTVTVPLNIAKWTAAAGLDVEIWTADRFGWEPPKQLCGGGATRSFVEDSSAAATGSITVKQRKGSDGFMEKGFVDRFADDLKSIDLLHIHNLWNPNSWHFINECCKIGKPALHTMHGMLMDWPMSHKRLKKLIYMKLVAGKQLRRTTAVHMLNAEETRQSRNAGANFRYFELPNGVDTSEFSQLPARGTYRSTEPAIREKTIILSVGRLHTIKGTDLLLGAFLELAKTRDDIALVLAGPDEGLKPALDQMLRGHPAGNRVKLPGLVQGDLRLSLLADADIYAHTSRHETMSMAILEAAFAGKCMLVTDRCNMPEIADVDAGVVVKVDQSDIGRGLEQLLADPKRMKDRGERAHRLVQQRFTAEAVTPKLIEHYQNLVSGKPYPWIRGDSA